MLRKETELVSGSEVADMQNKSARFQSQSDGLALTVPLSVLSPLKMANPSDWAPYSLLADKLTVLLWCKS